MKKLRVAIIASIFGDIGGPEIVTMDIAKSIQKEGVDVTLFCPADWQISPNIKRIEIIKKSLWQMQDFKYQTSAERTNLIISALVKFLAYQDQFDIVHISSQKYAYALCKNIHIPSIITLHNPIKERDLALLRKTSAFIVAQTEKYYNKIQADGYVHLGIPTQDISPRLTPGSGLIFIGRITEQKGVHIAIKIAKKSKKPLLVIGRIGNSPPRQSYYKEKILPHINTKTIRHIEKLSHSDVHKMLSRSEALLFPIVRPETFGRVSIESLACGTPVIGSTVDPLPEILNNKAVATLSEDTDTLVKAAKNTGKFDRKQCRLYAEKNFDSSRMANQYIKLYKRAIQKHNI